MGSCTSKSKHSETKVTQVTEPNEQKLEKLKTGNRNLKGEEKQVEIVPDAEILKQLATEANRFYRPKWRDLDRNALYLGNQIEEIQEAYREKSWKIEGDDTQKNYLYRSGIWAVCKKGLKSWMPNQDDFYISIGKQSFVVGVFDGHGPLGHNVSHFVKLFLPKSILAHSKWHENPQRAIKKSFKNCEKSLATGFPSSDLIFNWDISGTTSSFVYCDEAHLIVAHVGDSRVVMAKKINNELKAVPITTDHRPSEPREKARIEKRGGEILIQEGEIMERVYAKGKNYPGLAMSRSLGDKYAKELGVTHKPDIEILDISEEDEFILVCSDGIWEFISDQEAVDLIGKYQDNLKLAVEKLANLAIIRWGFNESQYTDDITIVLAYIPKRNTDEEDY
ncbi:unnamed protein product [Blepharisma stoltei]|uniref:PPM-type phosphatase domain-containing protein n=1 Tax=Blepharisma stoltei TaxID=1481888 RepID=A0AAU9IP74_9CILI|nr:unnamed protein product [Blepharisma stoltei]